jgi:hypothetical protein
MSRSGVGRLNKAFGKSRPADEARQVARLFVPRYESGIAINIALRPNRNSDARRRLGRLVEPRRVVS